MKRWLACLMLGLLVWIGWDLSRTEARSLREFDPHEVARIETELWRSYYEHRPVALYGQLVELLRKQYHLPFWSANLAAFHAARAAVVFQRGRERADYLLALPNLISYYGAIRRFSDTPFDADRAARLELEWWIVHRQRESHAPADLEAALAALQAEIYRAPADSFAPHSTARARAMLHRDASAGRGTTESDWRRVRALLDDSWASLLRVVSAHQAARL